MAAYMRKTGILPVCTNNEARAYFAGKGLTYVDVTEGEVVHTYLDHFIAVCGSFYITRDTMKIWLKLQTKSQKVQH